MPTPEEEDGAGETAAASVAAKSQAATPQGRSPWCRRCFQSEYIVKLEHYFAVNDIASSNKRRAILLTVVGGATYN